MSSFYCYLLRSVKTASSTSTYIGFTVDNKRRLRQHNGEIAAGAKKTSRGRPWEHVLIVSGFPNNITALQFEWQWQHPGESRVIRDLLTINATKRGYKTKIDILNCMLQSKLWRQLNLQVNFLNRTAFDYYRHNYAQESAICPRFKFLDSVEDIPRRISVEDKENLEFEGAALQETCSLCGQSSSGLIWNCTNCHRGSIHLSCLASLSTRNCPQTIIPQCASCPECHATISWSDVVFNSKRTDKNTYTVDNQGRSELEFNISIDDSVCTYDTGNFNHGNEIVIEL